MLCNNAGSSLEFKISSNEASEDRFLQLLAVRWQDSLLCLHDSLLIKLADKYKKK